MEDLRGRRGRGARGRALGAGDGKRFAFAYLFGFATVFAISLGALFFRDRAAPHLGGVERHGAARREEFIDASPGCPVVALLFVPVLLTKTTELYPWYHVMQQS